MLGRSRNGLLFLVRQMNGVTSVRRSMRVAAQQESVMDPATKAEDVNVHLEPTDVTAYYLARTLGHGHGKWYGAMAKHPGLRSLSYKEVEDSVNTLRHLKYTSEDIGEQPTILTYNALTIRNRFNVLRECGFNTVTLPTLSRYVSIMNKSVTLLKMYGYLPERLDITTQLQAHFSDVPATIFKDCQVKESMALKDVRVEILNCYLRYRLSMTDDNVAKLWRVYPRLRHKNFQSVRCLIHLLLEHLHFPKERVIKNAFVLFSDLENVQRIIAQIKPIDGHDITEILYKYPKLMMSTCETLKTNLKHMKTFGIPDHFVLRCVDVLTLGSDTIYSRLSDLHRIEQFKVLCTNPRILRLVHYQNKARLRLEYLSQLKVRCASLHILSCTSEKFFKFAVDGLDRSKGHDIIIYLSAIFGKNATTLRKCLTRHPNWCNIPILQVKHCYEYLRGEDFTNDNIYHSIHLLLYPINRIRSKFTELQRADFLTEMFGTADHKTLSKRHILTLTLYLIERDFHFTGDGIWCDEQHGESLNGLLPTFSEHLNEACKYGRKAAIFRSSNKVLME